MNALSSFALARLGAKPLEPFGKGSNALKAGTPDAGPGSYRVQRLRDLRFSAGTAVRSAPGRGRAEGGLIRGRRERQGYRALGLRAQRGAAWCRALDHFGEPHRQFDRLRGSACRSRLWQTAGFAQLFSAAEQNFHVLAQKLLPECRDRCARGPARASVTGVNVLMTAARKQWAVALRMSARRH